MGARANDSSLFLGQRCGPGQTWHPFVWGLHNSSKEVALAVTQWPTGAPLLVLGLTWSISHDGLETLQQDGEIITHPLPPQPTVLGMLDLSAGIGTWAAAATHLVIPLLGSLDFEHTALDTLVKQGHKTFSADFSQPGQWGPALATAPLMLCASPPCQPLTRAGLQGGYNDARAIPLLMLPVFAQWSGAQER